MPEFVLSSELPWTLRTLERTLSCMQHLVTSYMLWSREFLSADVTGMVVMFFRCSAEKLKVSSPPISYLKNQAKNYLCIFMCAVSLDIFWNPLLQIVHLYGSCDSSSAICQLGRLASFSLLSSLMGALGSLTSKCLWLTEMWAWRRSMPGNSKWHSGQATICIESVPEAEAGKGLLAWPSMELTLLMELVTALGSNLVFRMWLAKCCL